MAQLSLGDLKLGLKDLGENKEKQALLAKTKAGALYLPLLSRKRAAIEGLPPSMVDSGRPMAEQLGTEDEAHDGYGLAIWHLSEAYRLLPRLDAELREIAVDKVRDKVIATRAEVRKPYPEQAERAVDRAKELPKLKPELKKIPVAGGTLYDWVAAYTTHGQNLHDLLAARGAEAAKSDGAPTRKAAMLLRTETVGVLGRFREALGDEVEGDDSLPRNLDAQVFGYFDELLRLREAREAAQKPEPSAPDEAGAPT